MTPAQTLTLASVALLLIASHRQSIGAVEDGSPLGVFDFSTLVDNAATALNLLTEQPAGVDTATAWRNVSAFLAVLRSAEGTAGAADPYRMVYGYGTTLQDLSGHPVDTGEWRGVTLPDRVCELAGVGPGCRSTAAGAYQIIRPTWRSVAGALGLPDFSAASQDAAAIELIRRRGALGDVQGGRFEAAVAKVAGEWASLPGNYAGQGQRSMQQLSAWYGAAGGITA